MNEKDIEIASLKQHIAGLENESKELKHKLNFPKGILGINKHNQKCQHDWRQYFDWEFGNKGRESFPEGFFCTKCLERRDE